MEKVTQGHPMTQSPDFVKENIELLKSMFPTIVKEGKIDLEELQALLGDEFEADEEYYRFTWAGKSLARKEANKPSTATLRPVKADSKHWDTTQNIFIEGDNLEVLKLLQKSYANKIKIIDIDPPYNTGKDFVYKDNYSDNLNNYLVQTGQLDDSGKRTSTNTESDGRFHSNWLNMMYPRLKLARNLLTDDGAIFISIDDNEITNLHKICDEIYGEENFIGCIIVKSNPRGSQSEKYLAQLHEYILIFSKDINKCNILGQTLTTEMIEEYKYEDERGKYRLLGLRQRGGFWRRSERPLLFYPIYINTINGNLSLEKTDDEYEVLPIQPTTGEEGSWRWGKEKFKNELSSLIGKEVKRDGNIVWDIFQKDYLNQLEGEERTTKYKSMWDEKEINYQNGAVEVKELLSSGVFSFPKPTYLVKKMLSMVTSQNDIALDFFAGSGTTAHAIMQLNAEDNGNRKFICVQLPESVDVKSEAFKEGYKTISDITKERIRRAGEKIIFESKPDLFSENVKSLDIGFKSFRLDSSNINAWDGNPDNLQDNLFNAGSNIKENRTEDDVLFEILLKNGLDLSQPIEQKVFAGKNVFNIGLGTLFICLADGVITEVAEGIGKWKLELEPATCKVIFKDNGFTDVEKTNSMQILKRYGIEEVNTI